MTPEPKPPWTGRSSPPATVLVTAVLAAAGLLLAACGEAETDGGTEAGPPIEHVHGLGVNPADGALFIATHSGLFRLPEGASAAERVGGSTQDTMGFTVVGADRFLGSGHPGAGEAGPSNLGLIASEDGGETWESISLAGEADLHILRYSQGRIYALNGLTGRLLISDDGGNRWVERTPPPGLIDLTIDPDEPTRLLASTETGLLLSDDDGRQWRPVAPEVGLLAWPQEGSLFLIDAAGDALVSADRGESWKRLGGIDAQPSAFIAATPMELYAARTDGTVLTSNNGGATWEVGASQ